MKIKLIKKKKEAKNIKSFIFEKPKNLTFEAGQFIYLTLPKLIFEDQRGDTRYFTIASSPTEDYIMITTKIRKESGYKKTLEKLDIGSKLEYRGPFGDFVLDSEKKEQQIFLAGGIGITPFRSIIKYKVDKKFKTPIHLIYSCSTVEEIVYKDELEFWEKNKEIGLDITITHPEESKTKWGGLKGRINIKMLEKLTKNHNLKNTTFWTCGPPQFVSTMEKILENLEIREKQITREKFSGY